MVERCVALLQSSTVKLASFSWTPPKARECAVRCSWARGNGVGPPSGPGSAGRQPAKRYKSSGSTGTGVTRVPGVRILCDFVRHFPFQAIHGDPS